MEEVIPKRKTKGVHQQRGKEIRQPCAPESEKDEVEAVGVSSGGGECGRGFRIGHGVSEALWGI